MQGEFWAEKEKEDVKVYFLDKGEFYLSKTLNRSPSAVRSMANRMGLKKLSYRDDIELSYVEEQILLGSLMGDMYCRIKSTCKNATIEEGHSDEQKPYLLWKIKKIRNISFNFRKTRIGCWHCESKTYSFLNYYYNLFYKNGRKNVNINILNKIDVIGLAIWYMDDGSYGKRYNDCAIHSNGFTYNENLIMRKWFKNKWSLSPEVYVWKDEKRYPGVKHYYLRFCVADTMKLLRMIKPFVHSSMQYKLGIYAHEKNGKPMEVLKW